MPNEPAGTSYPPAATLKPLYWGLLIGFLLIVGGALLWVRPITTAGTFGLDCGPTIAASRGHLPPGDAENSDVRDKYILACEEAAHPWVVIGSLLAGAGVIIMAPSARKRP